MYWKKEWQAGKETWRDWQKWKEKVYEVIIKMRWKRAEMVLNISRQKKRRSEKHLIQYINVLRLHMSLTPESAFGWTLSLALGCHCLALLAKSLCVTQGVGCGCQGFASYRFCLCSFSFQCHGVVVIHFVYYGKDFFFFIVFHPE